MSGIHHAHTECANSCGLSASLSIQHQPHVIGAAFRNHLNWNLIFLWSYQIQTPIPFLESRPQNKCRGNSNRLVTRCENRAVSAWSPTDKAQIFAVSTSHLQHKYNFHASVRSANLGKLQWASKERSDDLTWQQELLLINLWRIWSIKVSFTSLCSVLGVAVLGVSSSTWCVF